MAKNPEIISLWIGGGGQLQQDMGAPHLPENMHGDFGFLREKAEGVL